MNEVHVMITREVSPWCGQTGTITGTRERLGLYRVTFESGEASWFYAKDFTAKANS